jgi:small subunit ribosomal protein S4
MGRDLGPACRKCRREGIKLMLKGTRCESAKCPMEKPSRNMPPGGSRAFRRRQGSEYGKRLRETQKVKRYYGLFDRQFRAYLLRAQRSRENTGQALLGLLERRLDNVVYKLGLAPSRKAARISIGHNHFSVNGLRVNKPGYLVKVGDAIGVRNREPTKKLVRAAVELDPNRSLQSWLKLDATRLEGSVVALPTRDDVQIPVEEQLVVEFYSR